MAGFSFSWQAQLAVIGIFGVGTYFLWLNRLPPFNAGGIGDQIANLMPRKDSPVVQDQPQPELPQSPISTLPVDPTTPPAGMPPIASTGSPQNGFPTGMGPTPMPPFQSSIQSDPSLTDYSVYENYAKQLQLIYGAQNRPNVGGSGIVTVGDPNLGTTPVPASWSNQPGGPMGYPGMGGGPSVPPNIPFLPNPMQYPGPIQGGPYPQQPPFMIGPPRPPNYPPMLPFFPPVQGFPPIIIKDPKKPPKIRDWKDFMSIDVGPIHIGMDGIKVGDLISIGGGGLLGKHFSKGIDPTDTNELKNGIKGMVDDMLKSMGVGGSAASKAKSMADSIKAKKSGASSIFGAGGIGGMFGG